MHFKRNPKISELEVILIQNQNRKCGLNLTWIDSISYILYLYSILNLMMRSKLTC